MSRFLVKPVALGVSLALLLSGCAVVGPNYQAPAVATGTTWQAALPHHGSSAQLAGWWSAFDDPTVARLVQMAEADSPSLATAAANIAAARAALGSARASAAPSLTGSASASRSRQRTDGVTSDTTTRSGGLDASWEIDLFGKLRRGREAAQARVVARGADWHEARVSLAAEVADTYVQYRACRLLARQDESEVRSQLETVRLTQVKVRAGFSAASDGDLAEASAASANATLIAQQTECEGLVKSLVALTGADEPALRTLIDATPPAVPVPDAFSVDGVPADLLRQRPDLVASERALAAASAEIGQAEAGRYPSFTLGGTISVSSSGLAGQTGTASFGPSLAIPLLDGGKARAAVDSAQASYDAALAGYRSAVRTAVKEVETALVNIDGAARRSRDARTAAERYRRYFASVQADWRAGRSSLMTLEEARRAAISAETTLLTLQRDQVRDWVALYKALGGGWTVDTLQATAPSTPGARP